MRSLACVAIVLVLTGCGKSYSSSQGFVRDRGKELGAVAYQWGFMDSKGSSQCIAFLMPDPNAGPHGGDNAVVDWVESDGSGGLRILKSENVSMQAVPAEYGLTYLDADHFSGGRKKVWQSWSKL